MQNKLLNIYVILGLFFGIVILVNILSEKFFFRIDLTEDQQYTLSQATTDILENLEEPITISAYFSDNLPPQYQKTSRDFNDLLIEYSNRSNGMVAYEFINPLENEDTERNAMMAGVEPVVINVREKDQVKQQKAFMGAVLQMGEQKEVLPFIQPDVSMEYNLTTNIKRMSVLDKPAIGIVSGHGEAGTQQMQSVVQALSVLYVVEPVTLSDTLYELDKYKSLLMIAPKDSIPQSHLAQFDQYLSGGGNMIVAINRVEGRLQQNPPMGEEVTTGLETWLGNKGLVVEPNFVIDNVSGSVSVRQGNFPFPVQVQFPYLPIIQNFPEHPITGGLEQIILQFASTISYTGDSTLHFEPIMITSEKSGTEASPVYFNIQKDYNYPMSNLPVAAVLTGKITGNVDSRMVVFGDGDFPQVGDQGQQTSDNVSLLVNAVDWLTDDTGLMELRTKGISTRPLDELKDSTKAQLKYLNFLLPILLVIIYGIVRMQINKNRRIKRMEDSYVR